MTLRPVTAADAETLFAWLNSEDSRRVSLQTSTPVPWDSHLAWLQARLADPDSGQWIAEIDGVPAGQVRIQKRDDRAEVSVFVAADFRGRGLGLSMLAHVVAYARTAWPDRPIVARIRPDNHQSMRLFTAAGFALAETLADHVMFIHGEERVDP